VIREYKHKGEGEAKRFRRVEELGNVTVDVFSNPFPEMFCWYRHAWSSRGVGAVNLACWYPLDLEHSSLAIGVQEPPGRLFAPRIAEDVEVRVIVPDFEVAVSRTVPLILNFQHLVASFPQKEPAGTLSTRKTLRKADSGAAGQHQSRIASVCETVVL
jgi:hypothetical protein